MKIYQIELNNGKSLSENAKDSAIATLIGYAKTYELLHKQLWRKNRVATVNYEFTFKGKTVKPLLFWNIKSPSVQPYDRDGEYNLGLNQLFVGQSPYSAYDGNPKDGIYHDDCLIQPKREDLPSNDTMGWYIEGHGHWRERDVWGEVLTTNVQIQDKYADVWVNPINSPVYNQYGEVASYVDYNNNVLITGTYGTGYVAPQAIPVYNDDNVLISYKDQYENIFITGYVENEEWVEPQIVIIEENGRVVRIEDINGTTLVTERQEWIEPIYIPIVDEATGNIQRYEDGEGNALVIGHLDYRSQPAVEVRDENNVLIAYADSNGVEFIQGHDEGGVWVPPVIVPIISPNNGLLLGYWDDNSNIVYLGTVQQTFIGKVYIITTPDGTEEHELLMVRDNAPENPWDYYPSVEYVNFTTQGYGDSVYPYYPQWADIPDYTIEHGSIVYETEDVAYLRPRGTFDLATWLNAPNAFTRVYADGTCIQIASSVGWFSMSDGSEDYSTAPASIAYLPLVYTDTGDLVMPRVDFIENWDDMFELYVHEDSYWYTPLIKIVVVVVSIVLAIFTGGGALAVMGAVLSSIGAISGNKLFSVLGAVLTLGAGLVANLGSQAAQGAMQKGLSERAASQIAQEAVADLTVMEALQGLSQAGLKEIVKLALQVNSLISTMANTDVATLPTEETQAEEGMKVGIGEEEDSYVARVMKIGELPSMNV